MLGIDIEAILNIFAPKKNFQTLYMLARGQKMRTALSLDRVERDPERRSIKAFEICENIIYSQTRANYVTSHFLCALAMPHT